MPNLDPVNGDPFASMTHQPERRAQPYMHPKVPEIVETINNFYRGGLQGAGMQMPAWMQSNPVQRMLQNPDNQAALEGMFPGGRYKIPISKESLQSSLSKGLTHEEIAQLAGVDRKTIQSRLKEYGLSATRVPKVRLTPRVGEEAEIEARNKQQLAERAFKGESLGQAKVNYGVPAKPAGKKVTTPKLKFTLEPVEHDPFAEENERIFKYGGSEE